MSSRFSTTTLRSLLLVPQERIEIGMHWHAIPNFQKLLNSVHTLPRCANLVRRRQDGTAPCCTKQCEKGMKPTLVARALYPRQPWLMFATMTWLPHHATQQLTAMSPPP